MLGQSCPWTSGDLTPASQCSQSVFGYLDKEVFAFAEASPDPKNTHSHPDLIKKPKEEPNPNYGGG